jgi:hypothetical protein
MSVDRRESEVLRQPDFKSIGIAKRLLARKESPVATGMNIEQMNDIRGRSLKLSSRKRTVVIVRAGQNACAIKQEPRDSYYYQTENSIKHWKILEFRFRAMKGGLNTNDAPELKGRFRRQSGAAVCVVLGIKDYRKHIFRKRRWRPALIFCER